MIWIFWDNLENPWFNPLGKADRLTVNESESCQIGLTSDLRLVVKAWVALHQEPQPVYNMYIYIYMCVYR